MSYTDYVRVEIERLKEWFREKRGGANPVKADASRVTLPEFKLPAVEVREVFLLRWRLLAAVAAALAVLDLGLIVLLWSNVLYLNAVLGVFMASSALMLLHYRLMLLRRLRDEENA